MTEGEEAWVIIAEDASLFITQDSSEHTEFCVAETGDGLAAVYCNQDTKTQQEGDENSIIVSLCCPPHLLVKVCSFVSIRAIKDFSLYRMDNVSSERVMNSSLRSMAIKASVTS